MRSATIPVSCPYCATNAVVDCDPYRFEDDRTSRLKGTDITCGRCDNEFELYYY